MLGGPYFGSALHYQNCLTGPIVPSITFGGVFAFMDSFQAGRMPKLQTVGTYMAGLYLYNIVQCPMEAFHGRQSLLHNFAAAGMLGYIGVANGRLGIPFVNPYTLHGSPLKPEIVAFGVYGSMAAAFAAFGGKQI